MLSYIYTTFEPTYQAIKGPPSHHESNCLIHFILRRPSQADLTHTPLTDLQVILVASHEEKMPRHLRKLFLKRFFTDRQKGTPSEKHEVRSDVEDVPHLSNQTVTGEAKLFRRQSLRSENEIRLLRFVPARNSSILQGKLVHVCLDDPKVQYTAISYCWGTDDRDQKFWISQDNYIPVTSSLCSVLQVLRSEDEQYLYRIDDD